MACSLEHYKSQSSLPLASVIGAHFIALSAAEGPVVSLFFIVVQRYDDKHKNAFEDGKQRQANAPCLGKPSLPTRRQEAAKSICVLTCNPSCSQHVAT